jgi:hypothetical protein
MTCFASDDLDILVYYVDPDAKITQLVKRAGEWYPVTLQWRVADDSPVICVFGNGFRLYYIGTDRQVHRLFTLAGTFAEEVMPGTKVAAGSGLACAADSGGLVMVCYVDATDNDLHVLAETDPNDPDEIVNDAVKGTGPAPGSALTCFNQEGTDSTRVYFLDRQGRINELAWNGGEQILNRLGCTAMPGSALASFAVEGRHTRLYYLDDQAQINELAWMDDRWVNRSLQRTAARDSALTCYGVDQKWTRLYYLDPGYRVNELAWDPSNAQFVNTPL